jgi:hypothetical protein
VMQSKLTIISSRPIPTRFDQWSVGHECAGYSPNEWSRGTRISQRNAMKVFARQYVYPRLIGSRVDGTVH